MIRLNLGCGHRKQADHVNVDKYEACAPDMVWDLERCPWPFETGAVAAVMLQHSLEHMGATTDGFLAIMQELYRVCAPEAVVTIVVPHPRSEGFAGDPTHVRPITPKILSLFSKRKNAEWRELGWPNTPLATYLDVDFETTRVDYTLTPHWAEQWAGGKMSMQELEFAASSYFNVIDEMRIELTVVK